MSGEDDLDAQLSAAYADNAGAELVQQARKDREKRNRRGARKDVDRAVTAGHGRTAQLNIKTREDVKRRLLQAVKQDGRPIAVIPEKLFNAFIAKTLGASVHEGPAPLESTEPSM